MNDRRQRLLRITKGGQDPPHSIERQVNDLWVKRHHALQ
jgi:hypothetical protein